MPSQRDIVPKLRNIWRPYCTIERSDIRIFFDHMRFYSTGSGFHGNLILCKTWIITQYASIVTILKLSRCITRSKNKYAPKSRRLFLDSSETPRSPADQRQSNTFLHNRFMRCIFWHVPKKFFRGLFSIISPGHISSIFSSHFSSNQLLDTIGLNIIRTVTGLFVNEAGNQL